MKRTYKGYQDKIKQQKIVIEGLESIIDNYRDYIYLGTKAQMQKHTTNKFLELEKKYEAYHRLDNYEKHILFQTNKERE
tara:strand:+ start:470 stop:706 length:237 start_codon:yes stop_codon:yes gene_type:complete